MMLDNQFNEFTVCIMDSYDMLIRLYASVNFPVYTTPSLYKIVSLRVLLVLRVCMYGPLYYFSLALRWV